MPPEEVDNSTQGTSIVIPVPSPAAELYRYRATDDVLQFLIDNPYAEFTIRKLARLTDYSPKAVRTAVNALTANDLVIVRAEGNRKPVHINRTRVLQPDDPVLRIPQSEFHEPVHAALDRLRDDLNDFKGVLVFGSVARGDADRRSDIDLWVLVQENRGTNQRRANEIGKTLGQQRFNGDRYEFQIMVESARSALNYADRLEEIIVSGITLYDTETLQRFKQEVLDDA